ncbi:hypothetical protein ACTFIZ_000502 [Dictyostelium cf. discoideum]
MADCLKLLKYFWKDNDDKVIKIIKAIYSKNYLKFEKQRFEKKKRADTKVKRDIIKHIMLKYPSEIAHLRQLQNHGYGKANFNTSSKGDKSSYSNDRLLNIYRTTGFNIITINEDYTSQRCCKCVIPTEDILMSMFPNCKEKKSEFNSDNRLENFHGSYKVLKCTKHHGVIHRDDNAFGNMTIKVAHWVYITLKGIEDSVIRSFSRSCSNGIKYREFVKDNPQFHYQLH